MGQQDNRWRMYLSHNGPNLIFSQQKSTGYQCDIDGNGDPIVQLEQSWKAGIEHLCPVDIVSCCNKIAPLVWVAVCKIHYINEELGSVFAGASVAMQIGNERLFDRGFVFDNIKSDRWIVLAQIVQSPNIALFV